MSVSGISSFLYYCLVTGHYEDFFLLIFSGTGSGVGTRVLEILQNEYPDVYRCSVVLSGMGPSSFEVLKAHAKNNLEY